MSKFPVPFQDHKHRKKIDLDHTKVTRDFKDFELPLSFPPDDDLRDNANKNGLDIQFADMDDNLLDFEIVRWEPKTGKLDIWIKIPELSSSVDTELRMYFGKPDAVDVSTPSTKFERVTIPPRLSVDMWK